VLHTCRLVNGLAMDQVCTPFIGITYRPSLRHWQLVLKYVRFQRVLKYSFRCLDKYSSRKLLVSGSSIITGLSQLRNDLVCRVGLDKRYACTHLLLAS